MVGRCAIGGGIRAVVDGSGVVLNRTVGSAALLAAGVVMTFLAAAGYLISVGWMGPLGPAGLLAPALLFSTLAAAVSASKENTQVFASPSARRGMMVGAAIGALGLVVAASWAVDGVRAALAGSVFSGQHAGLEQAMEQDPSQEVAQAACSALATQGVLSQEPRLRRALALQPASVVEGCLRAAPEDAREALAASLLVSSYEQLPASVEGLRGAAVVLPQGWTALLACGLDSEQQPQTRALCQQAVVAQVGAGAELIEAFEQAREHSPLFAPQITAGLLQAVLAEGGAAELGFDSGSARLAAVRLSCQALLEGSADRRALARGLGLLLETQGCEVSQAYTVRVDTYIDACPNALSATGPSTIGGRLCQGIEQRALTDAVTQASFEVHRGIGRHRAAAIDAAVVASAPAAQGSELDEHTAAMLKTLTEEGGPQGRALAEELRGDPESLAALRHARRERRDISAMLADDDEALDADQIRAGAARALEVGEAEGFVEPGGRAEIRRQVEEPEGERGKRRRDQHEAELREGFEALRKARRASDGR